MPSQPNPSPFAPGFRSEVASPKVVNRNIKLDVAPSDIVERLEVYKTLAADQDADAIGGAVNLVTETAHERPTYYVGGSYRLYRALEFVASGMKLSNEVFGFYNGSGL